MLEDEDKLIRGAKKGDRESFGRLYDHYIEPIYRFVAFKVTDKRDAEDLTHDVFLSAWQNIRKYASQGFPFSSWLYQVARNKVIDHYRTRKGTTSIDVLDEDVVKIANVVEYAVEKTLDLEFLQKAIRQLKDEHQNVLIMKFIEDLSNAEVAAALGKSEGAIRLIQHRAINQLKEILWKKPL